MGQSDTYSAMLVRELGPPEVLKRESLPRPSLLEGQVRVGIKAVGVNFPDQLMVAGLYQYKPPLPFSPGFEAAGEVIELGPGVVGAKLGDRVIVKMRAGAYATEAVVPERDLIRLPLNFSFAAGAAYLAAYSTAWVSFVARGGLQKGEWLLVSGAGGGVGLAAVDMGHKMGARVIAMAGDEARREAARSKGAEFVIDSRATDWVDRIKEITDGAGVDVIFDPVGGDFFDHALRCIAFNGRYLVVGFAAGRLPTTPANRLLLKGAALVGVRAGEYARRNPEGGRIMRDALVEAADKGIYYPLITATYPLNAASQALRDIMERKVTGKAVLMVEE